MGTDKKDLAYYMALPYSIKEEKLPEEYGGGFLLSIPKLGEMAVCSYGDTYSDALAKLEDVKRDYLERWLNAGLEIPE